MAVSCLQDASSELARLKLQHAVACATELRAACESRDLARLRAAVRAWEQHAGIANGFAAQLAQGPDIAAALAAIQSLMQERDLDHARCAQLDRSMLVSKVRRALCGSLRRMLAQCSHLLLLAFWAKSSHSGMFGASPFC